MKILILLIICLGLSAWAGGDRVGNGGDVVICQNAKYPAIELLDFHEAREKSIPLASLKAKDYLSKVKEVLGQTIKDVQPARYRRYLEWINTFEAESQFRSQVNLPDIDDSGLVILPVGCSMRQAVIQLTSEAVSDGEPRYIIDQEVWSQLDEMNRAGLLLHEMIYREIIASNSIQNVTSMRVRNLNRILFGSDFVLENYFKMATKMFGFDELFNVQIVTGEFPEFELDKINNVLILNNSEKVKMSFTILGFFGSEFGKKMVFDLARKRLIYNKNRKINYPEEVIALEDLSLTGHGVFFDFEDNHEVTISKWANEQAVSFDLKHDQFDYSVDLVNFNRPGWRNYSFRLDSSKVVFDRGFGCVQIRNNQTGYQVRFQDGTFNLREGHLEEGYMIACFDEKIKTYDLGGIQNCSLHRTYKNEMSKTGCDSGSHFILKFLGKNQSLKYFLNGAIEGNDGVTINARWFENQDFVVGEMKSTFKRKVLKIKDFENFKLDLKSGMILSGNKRFYSQLRRKAGYKMYKFLSNGDMVEESSCYDGEFYCGY